MPHKMNTRSCERVNGLQVVLRGYASMAAELAGAQWNEGDVFCSVVRRVALPDSFFAIDGQIETFLTVLDEFGAYPAVIQRELDRYLPFLATTKVLIAAVRAGMGRESAHHVIREHAVATALAMREHGAEPDLLDRLAADPRLPLGRECAGRRAGRQEGVHRCRRRPGRRGGRDGGRTGGPLPGRGQVHAGCDPVTLAGAARRRSTSPIWTTSPTDFRTSCSPSIGARHRCTGTSRPTTPPTARASGRSLRTPETLEVLRDPVTYSSVTGGLRPFGGTLLQDLAIAGQVLNMMDDPRHSQIRRLVSSGLTPRMIRLVEDDLRARTRRLLDAVAPGEPFDFLVDIAAELPMQMICILLGVPESERHWLFEAIEPQFDFGGSRKASLSQLSVEEAGSRMYSYGQELIASKRAEPTDDMLSVVANAMLDDADAPALSDLELYLFFSLLFSAGAETTRNAVAGGLLALAEHPEQLQALRADLDLLADGRRRDRPVDVAVAVQAAHRHPRRHARRTVDRGRPEGADLGGLGQPRRQRVRPRRRVRHQPKT